MLLAAAKPYILYIKIAIFLFMLAGVGWYWNKSVRLESEVLSLKSTVKSLNGVITQQVDINKENAKNFKSLITLQEKEQAAALGLQQSLAAAQTKLEGFRYETDKLRRKLSQKMLNDPFGASDAINDRRQRLFDDIATPRSYDAGQIRPGGRPVAPNGSTSRPDEKDDSEKKDSDPPANKPST